MTSNPVKNQHLLWRAGFGPAASQLSQLDQSPQQLLKQLEKASAQPPQFMDATDDYLKGLFTSYKEDGIKKREMGKEERKNIAQQTRESIKSLNLLWLDEMVKSDAQLREKMSLFWHGHFAARNLNVFYVQGLLDIIRKNALGSFRDMLHQVSKSAAMLNFLNAAQNRKGHPNENFAREVMELFTLGRGNYTENDIKEAARAFTGWSNNFQGEFVFRRFQHDSDNKTVLGKSGAFVGEDILNMLLDNKQTAYYITQKIYRYFVNEQVDKSKVEWLASRFYKSDYNIGALMHDIFSADWFYDAKNIGTRIKSPVELMAGIRRMLPMQIDNAESQLLIQRVLGQVLFYPPNVAGWPGGKSWIDSSTLMTRMRLPQMISDMDEINIKPKMDDDQMMGRMDDEGLKGKMKAAMGKAGKPIKAQVDWTALLSAMEKTKREELTQSLSTRLLQVKPSYGLSLISSYADSSSRESFIKSATIQIMSTPEYQMC